MQDKGDPSSSQRPNTPLLLSLEEPALSPPFAMQYNLSHLSNLSNLSNLSSYGGNSEEFVYPSEPASSFLPWSGVQLAEPHWAPPGLQFSYDGGFAVAPPPFGRMTAQEIMDAKALAASKSHSEAERRRRERINTHLAKLRSLLPSTTKTDKASLLAEVIQHVKELKRQTTEIAEESAVPTESDELTVDSEFDNEGRSSFTVSLCCEDRPELLSDLVRALKGLNLRPIKAEIATLGGRVRNVIVVEPDNKDDTEISRERNSTSTIHEALKAVMERVPHEEPSSVKRQRTGSLSL